VRGALKMDPSSKKTTLINKNEIKSQIGVPIFTKNFTTLINSSKRTGENFMDPLLNVSAVIIGKIKI
jgi:hypothetical protein